jgi:hypothetical protein
MEKAFDWTNRNLLFYRLLELNIDGKMFNAIKSLYSETTSKVRINLFTETDWFNVPCGVRQGDPLSPTLFSIYINSLIEDIKKTGIGIPIENIIIAILCYADDIILMAETEKDLQILLNVLYEWSSKWRMKININKSDIIHFRQKKKKQTLFNFKLGEETVAKVHEYKYLGLYLNEFLDYKQTAKYLADAASRATGSMISKFKSLGNVGFKTYSKLYYSGVAPILEYGSEVWGFNKFETCDKIQNRVLRFYLGVHKFVPTLSVNGDIGWLGTRDRRYLCMLRFWNRLINMDNGRLTKIIFNWDLTQMGNTWSEEIHFILDSLDLERVFLEKSAVDILDAEVILRSNLQSRWSVEIKNKPKLRTYILFKDIYESEKYVTYYLSRYQRSLLAQLRFGILPLHIETGRYQNKKDETTGQFRKLKYKERLCIFCDRNEVEDEIHFVLVCDKYENTRKNEFRNISVHNPNFENLNNKNKLVYLMKYEWRNLAHYVEKAWIQRQKALYV